MRSPFYDLHLRVIWKSRIGPRDTQNKSPHVMGAVLRATSPCFTPGTLIATDRGQQPVETLRRGDLLVTRDNGLKRIMWVGRRGFHYKEVLKLSLIHI